MLVSLPELSQNKVVFPDLPVWYDWRGNPLSRPPPFGSPLKVVVPPKFAQPCLGTKLFCDKLLEAGAVGLRALCGQEPEDGLRGEAGDSILRPWNLIAGFKYLDWHKSSVGQLGCEGSWLWVATLCCTPLKVTKS